MAEPELLELVELLELLEHAAIVNAKHETVMATPPVLRLDFIDISAFG